MEIKPSEQNAATFLEAADDAAGDLEMGTAPRRRDAAEPRVREFDTIQSMASRRAPIEIKYEWKFLLCLSCFDRMSLWNVDVARLKVISR